MFLSLSKLIGPSVSVPADLPPFQPQALLLLLWPYLAFSPSLSKCHQRKGHSDIWPWGWAHNSTGASNTAVLLYIYLPSLNWLWIQDHLLQLIPNVLPCLRLQMSPSNIHAISFPLIPKVVKWPRHVWCRKFASLVLHWSYVANVAKTYWKFTLINIDKSMSPS